MGCSKEERVHLRVVRAVTRRPAVCVFSLLGVAMIAAGATLGADPRSLPLIVLGTGLFAAPNMEQFEASTTGLKGKLRTQSVMASLDAAEADRDLSLHWMALLFCGDPQEATTLVGKAYASVGPKAPRLSPLEVRHHARCWLVDSALRHRILPRSEAHPSLSAGDARLYRALAALDPPARACVILHETERRSAREMAEFLGRPEDELRAVLADALAFVDASPEATS